MNRNYQTNVPRNMNHHSDPHETMTQQQLLRHISEVSFAVDDILLYLDTHVHDEAARAYANEMISMQKAASAVYARRFGPLTVDQTTERPCQNWEWATQPWPWETQPKQRGGCR